MLIRLSLLSSLALAACSGDPKPAEPVATEAPSAEPALVDEPTIVEATPAEAAPAPKAGTKEIKVWAATAPEAAPQITTPAPAPAQAAPAALEKDVFWVFVDGANVRAKPSLSAPIVGKLKWSEKVKSLGEANGFVKLGEGKFVHRTMLTDRKQRFGHHKLAH